MWEGSPSPLIVPRPRIHGVIASCICAPLLQVYHYPGFMASRDEPKLLHELRHNLTRPTAWEAVMRIRCSKGLRISSFHGHFFNRRESLFFSL